MNLYYSLLESLQELDMELAEEIALQMTNQELHLDLSSFSSHPVHISLMPFEALSSQHIREDLSDQNYISDSQTLNTYERMAIVRAKKLFNAEHVNIFPLSPADALTSILDAVLKPGAKLLGMAFPAVLCDAKTNTLASRQARYQIEFYSPDMESGLVDYEKLLEQAKRIKPQMLLAGFMAYPRQLNYAKLRKIADEVGAILVADISHCSGLVATSLYPSPLPHAHFVVGSTSLSLRGPRGGFILTSRQYASQLDQAVYSSAAGVRLDSVGKALIFHYAATDEFHEHQKQSIKNAKALVESFKSERLSVLTGGTDTHLVSLDTRSVSANPWELSEQLYGIKILSNEPRQTLFAPEDIFNHVLTFGTWNITARYMNEIALQKIAQWIQMVVFNPDNDSIKKQILESVKFLCQLFPVRNKTQLKPEEYQTIEALDELLGETSFSTGSSASSDMMIMPKAKVKSQGPKIKKTILAIDDDQDLTFLISHSFPKDEFDVLVSNDPREGLREAMSKKPDLVLLDVMMPGMDGLSVLKQLKSMQSTLYTPVLMLTATRDMNTVRQALELGAVDYIVKPFKPDYVLQRVKMRLHSRVVNSIKDT